MWRKSCFSFKSASNSLHIALTSVGRHIAVTSVNPKVLSVFGACRLIPLNKCPGVKPIRVGEVPRRIIAKAILKIIGGDVEEGAGPLQLCASQNGGCGAVVHPCEAFFNHMRLKLCFWLMLTMYLTRLIPK